jgi:DNA-binding NarL/FixJ family response regulator
MSKPRLVLADDHRMFAEGLRRLLEADYDIVAVAEDGRAMVAAAAEHRPDVVIADISMPKLNGIEAARQVLEADEDIAIVLLTMHADVSYATSALDAGVLGYVLKNSEPEELLRAIEQVLRGRVYIAPEIAADVFGARRKGRAEKIPDLTPRQREILRSLARGLLAKEIAAELDISRKTVEYHKYRMMDLLGLKTSAELIQYAVRHNIVTA